MGMIGTYPLSPITYAQIGAFVKMVFTLHNNSINFYLDGTLHPVWAPIYPLADTG